MLLSLVESPQPLGGELQGVAKSGVKVAVRRCEGLRRHLWVGQIGAINAGGVFAQGGVAASLDVCKDALDGSGCRGPRPEHGVQPGLDVGRRGGLFHGTAA